MTQLTSPADRRRGGRVTVLVICAVLVSMWVYVLFLAFFRGRADSPDKIDAPAFLAAAEQHCAAALAEIDDLPRAETQRDDPGGRADTLEAANGLYDAMLDDLDALTVDGEGDDPRLVRLWLGDWATLLEDRRDFVDRLRSDDQARLLITAGPSGRQITLRIDEFAGTNDMPSCASPTDA